MMSKSALAAAMAGGITTALVIAMASGLTPKAASAHGDEHGGSAEHQPGHGEPGHGEEHGTAGHEAAGDHGSTEHGTSEHGSGEHASGGHADDGHGPDPHAKPAVKTLTPSKPAAGHGENAAKADAPKADPHAKADAHDDHDDTPDTKAGAKAETKPSAKADPHAKAEPAKADPHAADEAPAGEADAALKMLKEGNERWVAAQATNPNGEPARRKELADKGQTPFATILSCSDSRMPVERIVDRGVGEVFTVRVAGNIAGTSEVGTVEYGVGHLHTPLLVVMGHTKCGAVAAAATGAQVHGKIVDIVEAIEPAVDRAKRKNPALEGAELAAEAVKENVWQTVFGLMRESKDIRALVAQGKVKVVGAVCDISTGKIEWLGEHPWQYEMIDALGGVASAEKADKADEHHK